MSFSSTTARVQDNGDGTTRDFAVTFPFQADADLAVVVTTDGVDATMTLNTDYTVSGEGTQGGGNVRFTTAPASGTTVTIFRDLALNQTRSFAYNGSFPTPTVTAAADKAMQAAQQLYEKLKRTFRISEASAEIAPLTVSARAGKVTGYDSTGAAMLYEPTLAVLPNGAAYDVATIAELRAIPVTDVPESKQIIVGGYYAVGDGGGGVFYYDSASALADNGGTVIAPNSGLGRWIRPTSDTFNVRQFGGVGAFGNDTTVVQNCVAAALARASATSNGIVIYFPAGAWVVNSKITIDEDSVVIRGDGKATTTIFRNSDFGDSIEFQQVNNAGLHDIQLYCYGETTTGSHVNVNDCQGVSLTNVILRRHYGGLRIYGSAAINIDDVLCETGGEFTTFRSGSYGCLIEGNPGGAGFQWTTGFVANRLIIATTPGTSAANAPEFGCRILCSDGLNFTNPYFGGARYNLAIRSVQVTGPVMAANVGTRFVNLFTDGFLPGSPTRYGVLINDDGNATTSFGAIDFVNCVFAAAVHNAADADSGAGVYVNSDQVKTVSFSNCIFSDNDYEGLAINNANSVRVTSCQLYASNRANASKAECRISGASTQVVMSGNIFGRSSVVTFLPSYGVVIEGTSNNILITPNEFIHYGETPIRVTSALTRMTLDPNQSQQTFSAASASPLVLPDSGTFFSISGTTSFSDITTARYRGREITLRFNPGGLTLTNSSGMNVKTGSFSPSLNDTITFIAENGGALIETSRSP